MSDMAMKYAMQKRGRKCMAHGTMDCMACGGKMAEGGEVGEMDAPDEDPKENESAEHEDEDMIGRIMKRRKMAHGGKVEEPEADFESADFDELDKEPAPHDADYTGANSGDEIGNGEIDENDHDLISRIMRSRAKRDRMPRPA